MITCCFINATTFISKNLNIQGENMQETNELLNKLKDKTGKFNRAMATL